MDATNGAAPETPSPAQLFRVAMSKFMQARVGQLQRDGLDPAATAVNLSSFGLQLEALVSLLMKKELISSDEFQAKATDSANRLAQAMDEQARMIITGGGLNG